MEADKREEWDMMLEQPLPGQDVSAAPVFSAEEEADSFMSAMTSLRKG
jgi:hypothetical protein